MSNFSPELTHAMYEWQEKDELNLLLAVQAISQESVENYNPEINLFDRIQIGLNKRFSYEAILSKINELKQRFYKTRGLIESDSEVERNKVFLISKDIWGRKENNGELGSKRSLENGNVEAEDGINDAERGYRNEVIETDVEVEGAQSGSGNETVDVEDRKEDGQSGIDQMLLRDMPDATMEMKDKENANLGGIENEMMEPKDTEKDFRRDEIMEMEDMEKDTQRDFEKETVEANDKKSEIKRGVGNEKIEVENKEQGKQSVQAVQIGVRCSEDVKLNSIVSYSVNVLKHAIKLRHKKKQFNVGGIDAKSNVRIQPAYKVLKNRTSMQKDSKGEILCFRCGKAGHKKYACTLENKIMEPLTEEQSTIGTSKGSGLEFENLSKSKEASTGLVLSKIKNRDDESKCMESNKCGKSFNVTNKRRLRTVLLEKRKQQQNLKSPPVNKKQTLLLEKRKQQKNLKSLPVNKKQKTGIKLYECGNLEDTASSCVQRKVVEHPTKKQETGDGTKVGQLEATTNKAVELSNEPEPVRSESVPKEHTANKNLEEKSTIPESVSYCHTSDNRIPETSGKINSEATDNKAVESSSTTKPIRSEPVTKERRANKNIEEKAAISESGSYHRTSEHKNTNEQSSNVPHDSTSEPRTKSNKFDSELRRESLPNNCETVCHQSSHEHKKESSNSREVETHHRYGQRYDEWRQYSTSRSPSVLHGHTYAHSYQPTPSRKAEGVHRFQSVSHRYSFESLSPRTHSNYSTGYANNLRPNFSHLQRGYHNQLMAQRAQYQYIQGQRMVERNKLNQSGYNHAYWHGYNGRDAGRHQSYTTQQPPLPTEPYPYPPPPPRHTEPYWHR